MPQPYPTHWLRRNLFNTPINTVFTCLELLILGWLAFHSWQWLAHGAQWQVVSQNLSRFFVGRYPAAQRWRLWLLVGILALALAGQAWRNRRQGKPQRGVFFNLGMVVGVVILGLWLIGGGIGLKTVPSQFWNGLLLTLLIALGATVLAFPFGVLLALGRQSQLPLLRWVCTIYIELLRGLPLIGVLFVAQVMLPLVLPGGWSLDRLLRAIVALVLFNAAYLAENVRSGLQAVPTGQVEAARSLGLNIPLTLSLVVLPQALRVAIPGVIGQFISMFKDTSLLSLFALLELTGMTRTILAQPQFLGRYAEAYAFIALIYWLFCFSLSRYSRRLETQR
jgi:general L-amino acid transport system permease protein